ncbi:hypothetical protein ACY0KE_005282, partial [Klebsiella pneumoniae]
GSVSWKRHKIWCPRRQPRDRSPAFLSLLISLFPVFTFFPQSRRRRKGIFRWLRAQKSQGEKIRGGKLSAGLMCEARQGYTGQVKRDRKKQHEDARHAVCAAAGRRVSDGP